MSIRLDQIKFKKKLNICLIRHRFLKVPIVTLLFFFFYFASHNYNNVKLFNMIIEKK